MYKKLATFSQHFREATGDNPAGRLPKRKSNKKQRTSSKPRVITANLSEKARVKCPGCGELLQRVNAMVTRHFRHVHHVEITSAEAHRIATTPETKPRRKDMYPP